MSSAGAATPTDGGDPGADDPPRDDAARGDERDLGDVPAVEVVTRAAVMLMSAAAEKLGLGPGPDSAARLDLDEARRLIEALAGLLRPSEQYLGMHRQPLRDGLRALQNAFREASPLPDPPGEGPGERR